MPFRKITFFICFIFLFSSQIFSQTVTVNVFMQNKNNDPESDTIYYNLKRKLSWQDFQGKVPSAAPWGAMTASGFSFNSSMEEDENRIDISVGVFTFFTKHDSWKKSNVNSPYHLEHEQHHFDITRLGAEKLVEEIRKAHFTKSNYRQLLHSIFDKVYNENLAWQHQYDLETKNSMDVEKQKGWNKKISDAIEKMEAKKD